MISKRFCSPGIQQGPCSSVLADLPACTGSPRPVAIRLFDDEERRQYSRLQGARISADRRRGSSLVPAKICKALQDGPKRPGELVDLLSVSRSLVSLRLREMISNGTIRRLSRGWYALR